MSRGSAQSPAAIPVLGGGFYRQQVQHLSGGAGGRIPAGSGCGAGRMWFCSLQAGRGAGLGEPAGRRLLTQAQLTGCDTTGTCEPGRCRRRRSASAPVNVTHVWHPQPELGPPRDRDSAPGAAADRWVRSVGPERWRHRQRRPPHLLPRPAL